MANDKDHNYVLQRSNVCSLNHFRSSKTHLGNLNMSMSQQLAKSSHSQFLITPQSLTEAMEYAKMISTSSFCPKDMRGKPAEVLIAVQLGAEVGISPIQALQNIAVISGRPCIWGDASLALVQASQHYVSHREWEEVTDQGLKAFCAVTRKGSDEYIKSFSETDAKKAGLWNKSGPWTQYPSRMLQMRARSFALRDKFADVLKGLSIREEIEDYPDYQEAPKPKVVPMIPRTVDVKQIAQQEEVVYDHERFIDYINQLQSCENHDQLKRAFTVAYKDPKIYCNQKAKDDIVKAKDKKKLDLEREKFLDEFDATTGEVVEVSSEVAS